MSQLLWVLGVSLSISFLCSVLEAVFLSVTPSWIGVLQERKHRAGFWLNRMVQRIDEPIAAILTLNTIAHTLGAAMGGAIALDVFGDRWIALFSAVLTFIILVFSEIIPKTLGATYWQALSVPTAYILVALVVVLKPILVPLSWFNRLIQPGGEKQHTVSRAEIEVLAEIGRRQGILGEHEWSVLNNVLRLRSVEVGEVMTPRTEMVAVPVEASVKDAMNLMLDEGRLRVPVYDGDVDHIVGVLAARDLWGASRSGQTEIRSAVRPITFCPAGKAVEELISEMREQRIKMVIVVDEFGGTAGLATLEDLIEEIIGDIQDEHEPEEPPAFEQAEDGGILVRGDTLVRELNESLALKLPEEEADTAGGFVFGRLGRVARTGDEVDVEGGTLRVSRVRGRRIERLRFIRGGTDGSSSFGHAKERP
ncbi:MAG: hemolysin family protein [Longimicrobiales bacterium]